MMTTIRQLSRTWCVLAVALFAVLLPTAAVGGQSSGACSGATPSQTVNQQVRISHPEFEAKGWKMKLRTGPSMDCEANFIWANDNLSATQIGILGEWSLVRFTHNGQSLQRWVENWSLENVGGGTPTNPGPVGPAPTIPTPPSGVPVVIFDTDMGPDIDDALALAALHEYADQGKAHIAAVTLSRNSNIGAQYIDQVNTFYGRPNIPIGVYRDTMGSTGFNSIDNYTSSLVNKRSQFPYDVNGSNLAHGYEVMRAVLEASPDNSVVIVQVGFSTNTAELLNRYPDLVRRKARLLSLMAGNVDIRTGAAASGNAEFNIQKHVSSAKVVFEKWPNQLVMSEVNLGTGVAYPGSSINTMPSSSIIRQSYQDPRGTPGMSWHPQPDMYSWDITSVIEALEPGFIPRALGPGKVVLDGSGRTSFRSSGGSHYILAEGSGLGSKKQALINRMVQLVTNPPRNNTPTPPASLSVRILQSNLRCDGVLRDVAVVSGFNANEQVAVRVNGRAYPERAADANGNRTVRWRCTSGGSALSFAAKGSSSGKSKSFSIDTNGRVATPAGPSSSCVVATVEPLPVGSVPIEIDSPSGLAISGYESPLEPWANGCRSARSGQFEDGQELTVLATAGSYVQVTGGSWVHGSFVGYTPPLAEITNPFEGAGPVTVDPPEAGLDTPLDGRAEAWGYCSAINIGAVAGGEKSACYFRNRAGDVVITNSSTGTFGLQLAFGIGFGAPVSNKADLSTLGGLSDCKAGDLNGAVISRCEGRDGGADVKTTAMEASIGFPGSATVGVSKTKVFEVNDRGEKQEATDLICAVSYLHTSHPPFCTADVA